MRNVRRRAKQSSRRDRGSTVKRILFTFVAALVLAQPVAGGAASTLPNQRIERVELAKGATSTVIKGEVKGDAFVDYVLNAGAGQTLSVTLEPSNRSNYFNVDPPGTDGAMFIGNISGNVFKGVLPTDGEYGIRVYLMRNAARRNESSRYTLSIAVTGSPLAPVPASNDAVIAGTPFHASAKISCAQSINANIRECEAFVIRRGSDGTATVEVRWPDGSQRRILFVKGNAVSSDAPETLSTERKGDVTSVRLGTLERFEIPDALVRGG